LSPPSTTEQRGELRANVRGRIRLFYGPDLSRWWDCTMRDLSASGMKLEAPSVLPLPDSLAVLDIAAAEVCIVQVRWRRGDMIGCRIKARHNLHEALPPPFETIRSAWRTLK
jgi:hypothetical protein